MSNANYIEKNRIPIKFHVLDGSVDEGLVYLGLHAARHEGSESVRDLLLGSERYLSIVFTDRPTKLVNRDCLVMVTVAAEQLPADPAVSGGQPHAVTVHLPNDLRVDGTLFFMLPSHRARVKDYLNLPEPFVELHRDNEICLVNKHHIFYVEEKS